VSAPARRPVAALAARLRPGLGAAATGNVGTTRAVSFIPFAFRSPRDIPEANRERARTGCRSSRAGQPRARSLAGPLSCLDEARFGIALGAVGAAARDALQEALAYAGTRVRFGRPISGFQPTRRKIADMAVSLNAAMLVALQLGRLIGAVRAGSPQPLPVSLNAVGSPRGRSSRPGWADVAGCLTDAGGRSIGQRPGG
jgi:hypothetical protein